MKQENNIIISISENVVFRYSKLGQPFFLKKDAKDCNGGINLIM